MHYYLFYLLIFTVLTEFPPCGYLWYVQPILNAMK